MKKWYTLWTLLLMAVLSVSFTSCEWDDDDAIAYTLEGTWRGNMYMSSEWDGRVYDATYSEICFLRDPYRYSSGTGYWIDYYNNDRYKAALGKLSPNEFYEYLTTGNYPSTMLR